MDDTMSATVTALVVLAAVWTLVGLAALWYLLGERRARDHGTYEVIDASGSNGKVIVLEDHH